EYAPFPFFMAYAASYLRLNGVDATLYDAVAEKHWDYEQVKETVSGLSPECLFIEVSTPLVRKVLDFAQWARKDLNSRIVLVGPHVHSYANDLLANSFVDHCIVGEYEIPALDIVTKGSEAKRLYRFEHLEDINTVNGQNFLPFRDFDVLHNYWDPSMNTPRPQLTISTSRGCPFKCTYCQWPKVMNNGQYRNRGPEFVIDEIRSVIRDYKNRTFSTTGILGNALINYGNLRQRRVAPLKAVSNALLGGIGEIRSIFFDDDTWNLGAARIK